MYSLFWLIGGLTLPAVNAFGKLQLFRDLDIKAADDSTSLLAGFLMIGIAAGWLLAARVSEDAVRLAVGVISIVFVFLGLDGFRW